MFKKLWSSQFIDLVPLRKNGHEKNVDMFENMFDFH